MAERDVVPIRGLLIAGVSLGVLAVVVHVGIWLLFGRYDVRAVARDPEPGPMAAELGGPREPPGPRLRVAPVQDLREVRDAEVNRLRRYGWVDHQDGIIHLPIERAIELVAERGLPARAEAPEDGR